MLTRTLLVPDNSLCVIHYKDACTPSDSMDQLSHAHAILGSFLKAWQLHDIEAGITCGALIRTEPREGE